MLYIAASEVVLLASFLIIHYSDPLGAESTTLTTKVPSLLPNKRCKGTTEYGNNCGKNNFCNPTTFYCEPCSRVCQVKVAVYTYCKRYCPSHYKKLMYNLKHKEKTTESSIEKVTLNVSGEVDDYIQGPDKHVHTHQSWYKSQLWLPAIVVAVIAILLLNGSIILMFYKLKHQRQNYKDNITLGHKNNTGSFCGTKSLFHKCCDIEKGGCNCKAMSLKGDMKVNTSASIHVPEDSIASLHSQLSEYSHKTQSDKYNNSSLSSKTVCGHAYLTDCCSDGTKTQNVSEMLVRNNKDTHKDCSTKRESSNSNVENKYITKHDESQNVTNNEVISNPYTPDMNVLSMEKKINERISDIRVNTEASQDGIQQQENRSDQGESLKFDIDEVYTSYVKAEEPLPKPAHFTEKSLLDVTKSRDRIDHSQVLEAIRNRSGEHQVANEAIAEVNVREYTGYDSEAENETLLKEQPPTTIDCTPEDCALPVNQDHTPNDASPANPEPSTKHEPIVNNEPQVHHEPPVNRVKPMAVASRQPVQESQPLIDRAVQPQRQRRPPHPNKRIYDLLKAIDWVDGYYSEGRSIEVYCDLTYVSHDVAMQELVVRTGESRDKFHLLQSEQHLC